jgi:hypothetical protein
MGGAASIMPDNMDLTFLQTTFANFDMKKYEHLCDENGMVDKKFLLAVQSQGVEKEVYLLWCAFCPMGDMGVEEFLSMLHDTKCLSKGFNRRQAEVVFRGANFWGKSNDQRVNYEFFRTEFVVLIAKEKTMPVLQLLQKMALCEGPIYDFFKPTDSAQRSMKETLLIATATVSGTTSLVAGNAPVDESKVAPLQSKYSNPTSEQIDAAKQIQKVTRANLSRKRVQEMKEVRHFLFCLFNYLC